MSTGEGPTSSPTLVEETPFTDLVDSELVPPLGEPVGRSVSEGLPEPLVETVDQMDNTPLPDEAAAQQLLSSTLNDTEQGRKNTEEDVENLRIEMCKLEAENELKIMKKNFLLRLSEKQQEFLNETKQKFSRLEVAQRYSRRSAASAESSEMNHKEAHELDSRLYAAFLHFCPQTTLANNHDDHGKEAIVEDVESSELHQSPSALTYLCTWARSFLVHDSAAVLCPKKGEGSGDSNEENESISAKKMKLLHLLAELESKIQTKESMNSSVKNLSPLLEVLKSETLPLVQEGIEWIETLAALQKQLKVQSQSDEAVLSETFSSSLNLQFDNDSNETISEFCDSLSKSNQVEEKTLRNDVPCAVPAAVLGSTIRLHSLVDQCAGPEIVEAAYKLDAAQNIQINTSAKMETALAMYFLFQIMSPQKALSANSHVVSSRNSFNAAVDSFLATLNTPAAWNQVIEESTRLKKEIQHWSMMLVRLQRENYTLRRMLMENGTEASNAFLPEECINHKNEIVSSNATREASTRPLVKLTAATSLHLLLHQWRVRLFHAIRRFTCRYHCSGVQLEGLGYTRTPLHLNAASSPPRERPSCPSCLPQLLERLILREKINSRHASLQLQLEQNVYSWCCIRFLPSWLSPLCFHPSTSYGEESFSFHQFDPPSAFSESEEEASLNSSKDYFNNKVQHLMDLQEMILSRYRQSLKRMEEIFLKEFLHPFQRLQEAVQLQRSYALSALRIHVLGEHYLGISLLNGRAEEDDCAVSVSEAPGEKRGRKEDSSPHLSGIERLSHPLLHSPFWREDRNALASLVREYTSPSFIEKKDALIEPLPSLPDSLLHRISHYQGMLEGVVQKKILPLSVIAEKVHHTVELEEAKIRRWCEEVHQPLEMAEMHKNEEADEATEDNVLPDNPDGITSHIMADGTYCEKNKEAAAQKLSEVLEELHERKAKLEKAVKMLKEEKHAQRAALLAEKRKIIQEEKDALRAKINFLQKKLEDDNLQKATPSVSIHLEQTVENSLQPSDAEPSNEKPEAVTSAVPTANEEVGADPSEELGVDEPSIPEAREADEDAMELEQPTEGLDSMGEVIPSQSNDEVSEEKLVEEEEEENENITSPFASGW